MYIVFDIALAWLVYIYLGYPLLLYLLSRWPRGRASSPGPYQPRVSILIAAYNEEECIARTVENKLGLDYPAELVEVIIVSDGSTDGTNRIVRSLAAEYPGRVRLIEQTGREGKTAALNVAASEARGEIIVFSDANSIYDEGAVGALVDAFRDPSVGYVTGKMVYTSSDGSLVGEGCTAYMRYENQVRTWESRIGSIVGTDGGIDAIRRKLFQNMRPDQLPDFVLPLMVVDQGYRVVFESRAVVREPVLATSAEEYRMRVRVALRALWAIYDYRHLLNPFRFALFSWQLLSHKLLRYLAFLPQVVVLVANVLVVQKGPAFAVAMVAQGVFYLLALAGHWSRRSRWSTAVITAPYYLCLLNLACSHAFVKFLRREKQVIWSPRTG